MKLLHAFSPGMLVNAWEGKTVKFKKEALDAVLLLLKENGLESCIGHENLAAVLSDKLGHAVVCSPKLVKLEAGETAILAQYYGPRMTAETRELPDRGDINFFSIRILPEPGRGYKE